MRTTLLIDADIVAYRFASKAQRVYEFGTAVDDLDEVTPLVADWVEEQRRRLSADDVVICLSCPNSQGWRKQVFKSYKNNRKSLPKPELLLPIKDWLAANYRSYRRPGLEADDIMGILSTHETLIPGKKIIVSEDKDMKTVPGWLFNPEKDSKPRFVDQYEADYWHLFQTLVGDSTDGYPGCPGVGPKKAESILFGVSPPWGTPREAWRAVVDAYAKKGLTEQDALVQARVARICRASDYDFKRKEVILWNPPD